MMGASVRPRKKPSTSGLNRKIMRRNGLLKSQIKDTQLMQLSLYELLKRTTKFAQDELILFNIEVSKI